MRFTGFFLFCITGIVVDIVYADDIDTSMCNDVSEDSKTYYPVPGDCTKYIECNDYEGFVFECPAGTWWHQEILDCDYPGSYCTPGSTTRQPAHTTTRNTESPESTTRPFTTSSIGPTPPSYFPDPRCIDNSTTYWPHPKYCHRYIECFKGDSYDMQCALGLFFSDYFKECVNSIDSECCKGTSSCA